MTARYRHIALLSLVLVALALRLYRLDAADLWGDEAFSIFLSQQLLGEVVAGGADTHPPFYPILLLVWMKLSGISVFATRALSAFVGVLATPLLFILARRVASVRVAWFAATLVTVSPLLIYYSQETRMYELVAVLSLAATYFFSRLVLPVAKRLGSESLAVLGAFVLITILAIYTHYSAFYVLAAQNLHALIVLRQARAVLARWLLVQAVLVISYLPWVVAQTGFLQEKASARWDEFSWRGIEMIFGKVVLAFSVGLALDPPVARIGTAISLALVGMGIFAIVQARGRAWAPLAEFSVKRREPPAWNAAWFAPLYLLVPILIAFLVNPIFPFFFERYVLVALPGFYLTLALGLDFAARFDFRAAVGITALFVAINLFALMNYYFNDAFAKGKYGQMMAHVAENTQTGDALVLNNPLQKPLYYYYAPQGVPAFFLPDGIPLEDPRMRARLEEIAHKHPRVWLVMFGSPAEYDPTNYLKRWLGANAFKSYFGGFVDASLTLYEMPRASKGKTPVNATLDEAIHLLAFEVDHAEVLPGQTVQLTLHWQASSSIDRALVVFTHLIGKPNPLTRSSIWAQMDNEPVGGSRATTTWKSGEHIVDRYGLHVPRDTPPGEYEIEVGMYDPSTGARVSVGDWQGKPIKEERVLLSVVKVK